MRTSAVCSSTPTSTASRASRSTERSRQVVGRAAVVREHGEAGHEPEPDRVRAAAGIDHRVAQHRRARARRGDHRAPAVRVEHRLEERAALQHRAQVQRRAVGEVDEPRDAHRRRRSRRPRRRAGSAPSSPVDLSRPDPRSTPRPARPPARDARTRPRSGARAPRRCSASSSSRLSKARHGSVHSPPPSERDGPRRPLRHAVDPTVMRPILRSSRTAPGRHYPPVAFRPSLRRTRAQ